LMSALMLTFGFILTWRGMVGNLWAGLSGSRRRYAISLILQVVSLFILIRITLFAVHRFEWKMVEQYVTWLEWALALAVGIKFWLAACTWRKITPWRKKRYALIWILGTAPVMALGWLLCPNIFWLKPLVLMAALLPFPLARMGLAPGALKNNQHRL
ncbi:MAG TPA: hypothetical protein VHH88_13140, partial [Verrucomicrobiae bacterium]|nr:hypothetical protein [Verrucomicrobiae bacterium]